MMFRRKKNVQAAPDPTDDVMAGLGLNRNDLAQVVRNEDIRKTLEDIRDINKELLEVVREYVNRQT